MAKDDQSLQKVVQGLSSLQSAHKEILDKFAINSKAKFNELLDTLKRKSDGGDGATSLSKGKLKDMMDELADLKVKPEKGRGKDLYRIEKLLDELVDIYHRK